MSVPAQPYTLHLPQMQVHQHDVLDSEHRYKLWRAGRRTGKSTGALVAASDGHGPRDVTGKPAFVGMLHGGRIAWIAKTYKQSKALWRRLLRRYAHLEGPGIVKIDREDKRIDLCDGRGCIAVWSGHTRDALDNLRGDYWDGVIVDEGAYLDLEYALNDVILPALLDVNGWLIVTSTPNASWDGNEQRIAPSYFNRLCMMVMAGDKGPSWGHWHHRPEDNKALSAAAIAELRSQYPADSATAQQELDALLVAGGLLALTIDRDTVLVPAKPIPKHWTCFLAIDWGYSHPFSCGLFACNESGRVQMVDSVSDRRKSPQEIAEAVRKMLARNSLRWSDLTHSIAGGDVFDEHGQARGLTGPTIAEQWSALGWEVIKSDASGPHKRVLSLNNIRLYLREGQFTLTDNPSNRRVLTCLETRITDPNDAEDVLKQDADGNGIGGDDDYDMVRYALFSRPLTPSDPFPALEVQKVRGQLDATSRHEAEQVDKFDRAAEREARRLFAKHGRVMPV